jgi:aryl-alcohol dehydrogenase
MDDLVDRRRHASKRSEARSVGSDAMKIRAAVSVAEGELELADVELDDPRDDEVLVRLVASGVCHTDISAHEERARSTISGYPVVLGHEGAGVVEAVGRSVTRVRPGDQVVMSYRSCRRCGPCLAGARTYCAELRTLNYSGTRPDGSPTLTRGGAVVGGSFFGQSSFATHALANEENVVAVGPETDLAVAAPLGCGFQTGAGAVINVLEPRPGTPFGVFGAGSVGLAALLAGLASGAHPLVAVDPSPARREVALTLGADHALDPAAEPDLSATIRDLTRGGLAAALDSSGVPAVVNQAVAALGVKGVLATVAHSGTVPLEIRELIVGGKSIRGVVEGDSSPETFIPMLISLQQAGRLPLERLITTYPFDEIERAFREAKDHVAVTPVLLF